MNFLKKTVACFKQGFSLIELMISLITISCITAAFTPIITKKLKNSNISVALSEISTKCQTKFTDQCSLCYSQKCVVCTRSCGEYQYKNTGTCLCENCSDRGVGCAWCDGKYCTQCHQGYGYDSAAHSCTLCKAGTYSDGTKPCEPCPAGSYANVDGANECTQCPEGQYQPQTGQIGCGWCGAAKWSNSDRTGCEPCPKGYECYANATRKQCSIGYYSQGGLEACLPCPAGQYQNQTGQEGCGCCPINRWSYGGASSCVECPAGYQCNGNCSGSTNLQACSGGYYSLGGYSSTPTCTSCPENQWSNDDHTGCKWCDAGYQCSKNGNIEACTAGHYSEGGGSSVPKCKACPAGTYQPATGQPGCGWCDAGTWSGEAAIECKSEWCGAGYACLGGPNAIPCGNGTFSSSSGSKECTPCGSREWSTAPATSCYSCGEHCASCNASGCTKCDSGYKVSGTKCVAESCASGWYLAGSTCTICAQGNYCPDGIHSYQCTGNNYSTTTGATSCKTVNKNPYLVSEGKWYNLCCVDCASGADSNHGNNGTWCCETWKC